MAVSESHKDHDFSDHASLEGLVGTVRSLGPAVRATDVGRCDAATLEALTSIVRHGQHLLDVMIVEIAIAANALESRSQGRGVHGTLVGDGTCVHGRTARTETDRARVAAEFDLVGRALREGRIGAAQVDAIARAAERLDDNQRTLLNTTTIIDAAATHPVDVFTRMIRREVDRIQGNHGLDDTKARQARSSWKHWFDDRTGMGHIHGEFDPERYETIVGSVEAELTKLANNSNGVTKNSNLAAQAAYQLLTSTNETSGSGRPHLNVVVDWDTFANGPHDQTISETAGGHRLPPQSLTRIACDSVVQRVTLNKQGVPINVGRRHRTATDAQWQATRAIYRTCAWNSCHQPLAHCQLHHIHQWANGGPTNMCNLIPLCNQHHHAVHEGQWTIKLDATNRKLDIYSPDGRHHTTTIPDRFNTTTRAGPTRA